MSEKNNSVGYNGQQQQQQYGIQYPTPQVMNNSTQQYPYPQPQTTNGLNSYYPAAPTLPQNSNDVKSPYVSSGVPPNTAAAGQSGFWDPHVPRPNDILPLHPAIIRQREIAATLPPCPKGGYHEL